MIASEVMTPSTLKYSVDAAVSMGRRKQAFRQLLCGATLLVAIGIAPAIGQAQDAGDPPVQKYLSDIKLKRDGLRDGILSVKKSSHPEHRHSRRAARPWPGPDVAYEVQPWTDGAVTASGWCFALDPQFPGLAQWRKCAQY